MSGEALGTTASLPRGDIFYAVTFRSALDVRGEPFDRITLLVSLAWGDLA